MMKTQLILTTAGKISSLPWYYFLPAVVGISPSCSKKNVVGSNKITKNVACFAKMSYICSV